MVDALSTDLICCFVKLFYTGPLVNAEMLVVMLEKHGVAATQSFVDPDLPDDGDLSRPAQVFVPESDTSARTGYSTRSARTSCSHVVTASRRIETRILPPAARQPKVRPCSTS